MSKDSLPSSDDDEEDFCFKFGSPTTAPAANMEFRSERQPVEQDEDVIHFEAPRNLKPPAHLKKISNANVTDQEVQEYEHSILYEQPINHLSNQQKYQNELRRLQKCMGQVVHGDSGLVSIIASYWSDISNEKKCCQLQLRNAIFNMVVESEGVLLDRSLFLDRKLLYHHPHHYMRLTSTTAYMDQAATSESIKAVGAGQFGQVFLAIDLKTKQRFAEKIVPLQKFCKNEIEILSQIQHRHIVKLLGVIRTSDGVHIFMQYADGGNVDQLLTQGKGFTGSDSTQSDLYTEFWSLQYYKQIMSAIMYLHSVKIVHCDIKASNVILSCDKTRCFLADFGEAQRIPTRSIKLETENGLIGTESHMSPEVVERSEFHYTSDLWSAGCFLLNMLNGSPPWSLLYPDVGTLLYVITQRPFGLIEEIPSWVAPLTRSILCSTFDELDKRKTAVELLALSERNLKILEKKRVSRVDAPLTQHEVCISLEMLSSSLEELDYANPETAHSSGGVNGEECSDHDRTSAVSQQSLAYQRHAKRNEEAMKELSLLLEQSDIPQGVDELSPSQAVKELNELIFNAKIEESVVDGDADEVSRCRAADCLRSVAHSSGGRK